MTIVRRIARPLLAAPLIQSGVEVARHPAPHAEAAKPVLDKVAGPLRLPNDPVMVVRSAGAVTALAGSLLAIGRLPRLSALAIVATAPVVQPVEPFWKEKDPTLRREKQATFVKTLGLIGGALLATVDTEGKPSVAYRGRRAGRKAAAAVQHAGGSSSSSVSSTVSSAATSTRKGAKQLRKATKEWAKDAEKAARQAAKDAEKSTRKSRRKAGKAARKQVIQASKAAQKAGRKTRESLPV